MALRDLTVESVHAAVQEFDKLGRDKFLTRYGFRPAKHLYLKIGEHVYDSKAIAESPIDLLCLRRARFGQQLLPAVKQLSADGFKDSDLQLSRVIAARVNRVNAAILTGRGTN